MTDITHDELYDLLPVVYRLRDVEQGYPLKAFLRVVTEQVDLVKRHIDQLWDDVAIETCQPWVIPYIGDLVGNNLLHDAGARTRVDVARTIFYRRRKGTLPVLEQLAQDVTGWRCHAVELFELLGWTQNLNHRRMHRLQSPDLRDMDRLDRLDGPFDEIAHTVDVRPPSTREGRYAIPNIGLFLYRLTSYPLRGTQARRARPPNGHGYHFSPLGAPTPLFNRWRSEVDEAGLTAERFVPGPIRPLAFHADLERYRDARAADRPAVSDYTGKDLSVAVYTTARPEPVPVPTEKVLCKDLANWDPPPTGFVAVDVRRGRIAFAKGEQPAGGVTVEYHYGFSGDVGGGPYDRRRRTVASGGDQHQPHDPDTVADPTALGTLILVPSPGATSIQDAVDLWRATSGRPPTVIQIQDSRTYEEDLRIRMAGDRLTIQAANRRRPTLVGRIEVTGDNPDGRLDLDGLLVEGWIHLTGDLKELRLRNCTLVPGRSLHEDGSPAFPDEASLVADPCNVSLQLTLERTITGPLRLPEQMPGVAVRDSILDGGREAAIARTGAPDRSGPPAELRRATVFGAVQVRELSLASEVVFTGPVRADRAQGGCVRFSYLSLPPDSRVPRRYQCQPDLALAALAKQLGRASAADLLPHEQALVLDRLHPAFTSERYGDPGYGQLSLNCPVEITTGAEDGSEMGAFSGLRQPQREANLRIRLAEYLPFGLQPALIYVT